MVRRGTDGKSVSNEFLSVKALGEIENMWEYVSFNRLLKISQGTLCLLKVLVI